MTVMGAIEVRRRTKLTGLEVYLASLYHCQPNAHLVLFNRSPEHVGLSALLTRYPVDAVDAQQFDKEHDIPQVEIEIARFLEYAAWLEEYAASGAVMLTDVLDVLWQPGGLTVPPALTVFQENNRIGACPYNLKWVKEVWPNGYGMLLDRPIVCCGVIMGSEEAVCEYLAWYAEQVEQRGARTLRRGFDSAALNGLAYSAPVNVLPFANALCMHLGYADPMTVNYSEEDGVTWCGERPMVVHQYNRHPAAMQGIYERWT